MAHVLTAESGADGLTRVQVATSVSTIVTVTVPTSEWYAMTADTLDAIVRQAVATRRPRLRRR